MVETSASEVPTAALVPELKVADFGRSRAFYVDLAGFAVLYERPEQAFAYLQLGRAELMIEQDDGMWRTGPLEHPYGRGINLQIMVADLAALWRRLVDRQHPIMVPLEERWYRRGQLEVGQLQFLVQDPDGYLLRFGEDLGIRPGGPEATRA
jgi:catechol 2,3-dioxygenase-like lactoylglutathione lyase family enzyme